VKNMKSMIGCEYMPGGKHILGKSKQQRVFGTAKVGDRGQIVIPKPAREMFNIEPGDTIVLLADKKRGIALVQNDKLMKIAESVFDETLPESEDDEKVES
jgi:AbrB family looped-hinge helix DNA binding protein